MNQAVEQLLAFLEDVQPAPRSLSQTAPGPGPMRKEPCANCNGTGRVKRFNNRPCLRCGGIVERNKEGRGWVWYDDYTEDEVGHEETTTTDSRVREITCWTCNGLGVHPSGRRCIWCLGTGKRRLPPVEPDVDRPQEDATIAALQATRSGEAVGLRRRGSFDSLELGLDSLTHRRRLLVVDVYVTRRIERGELSDVDRDRLSAAMRDLRVFIEAREGRVRVPMEIRKWWADGRGGRVARGPHANGFARGTRNREIRALADQGWSHGRIAEKIGISRSAVSRVLGASPGRPRAAGARGPGPATVGSGEPRGEAA